MFPLLYNPHTTVYIVSVLHKSHTVVNHKNDDYDGDDDTDDDHGRDNYRLNG